MKQKIERAMEETKRLGTSAKRILIPAQCECKIRNDHPFTSVKMCPVHGDERFRRKYQ